MLPVMDDDIQTFLRLSKEERAAAWKGRQLTQVKTPTGRRRGWRLPKSIDSTGPAILRQSERDGQARKAARLAAVRNR
jgi:hypothetical protein